MLIHVLVAVDRPNELERLRRIVAREDVALVGEDRADVAFERLNRGDFDLLIVTPSMLPVPPAAMIRTARGLPERPELVVLTDEEHAETRATLLAAGCLAVLNLGLDDDVLGRAIAAIIDRRRQSAIERLRAERPEERYSLADFVSDSPSMQRFLELARKVVRSDSSVLLLGETGVGKERLARAIHAEGPRADGPFVAVNCGAIPESLLESELFGHEEGAFTGASRSRKGYFELAHSGTLFLDEIGEMPTHLQVKLLRALDDRAVFRIGAEKPTAIDVRVMAATNKDLEAEMGGRQFRADLFYRLAVVTLTIPPLRERREDIRTLVEEYLSHFRAQTGMPISCVSGEAMAVMERYEWPGNVRELVNAIERAFLLCRGDTIRVVDLPARIASAVPRRAGDEPSPRGGRDEPSTQQLLDRPLAEARQTVVEAFETSYLTALLRTTGGRIGETAARAGISERSLYDLMKRRGLRKEEFRAERGR